MRNLVVHVDALAVAVERLCPGRVEQNVDLASRSQWAIGGTAQLIVHPTSTDEVVQLRRFFHQAGVPHLVIGGTTNLLFSDDGLKIPCIQIGPGMSRLSMEEDILTGDAGAWVPALSRRVMQMGRTGAEHVCGIPGTLGGLIYMNGGSQRRGIGQSVQSVTSVDQKGEIVERCEAQCQFAYRSSVYQDNDEIIVSGRLKFGEHDAPDAIRRRMLKILRDRRMKFPRKLPNCGSVFKSDPSTYAQHGPPGAVIEKLGYKGYRIGNAIVSPLHANFITNLGGARARDVISLIRRIHEEALKVLGVDLISEVRLVTADGALYPAHMAP